MDNQTKELLHKYLNGTASIEEQVKVEKLIRSEGFQNIKKFIRKDWDEYFKSDKTSDKDLSIVLGRIHHSINLKENKLRNTFKYKIYRLSYVAAAALVIPLLIASIYMYSKWGEMKNRLAEKSSTVNIFSPLGSKYTFTLPDGTVGVLNGGSSIEYPVPFKENRNVKLYGEAFFDVEHDKNHPFIVSANQVEIKVLGTRFNVNSVPEEGITEVTLEEGSLECNFSSYNKKIRLSQNQKVVLSSGKLTKSEVDATKLTAWKEGMLILNGDSMKELARKLTQWYNVDVEITDKELYSYSFRGSFDNDPLEEVVRLLKITSPIDYKIIERQKLTNNKYTKKKVVFSKRN